MDEKRHYHTIQRGAWKSDELDGRKPTVYDWCRLAAFIDGEGALQVNPYNKRKLGAIYQIRVAICNTNPLLPAWLIETFGGHIVTLDRGKRHGKGAKWATSYYWTAVCGRGAWVLYNALPWLLLKKQQAELLLELQERIDKTKQGKGRTVPDVERDYRATIKERVNMLNLKGPKE